MLGTSSTTSSCVRFVKYDSFQLNGVRLGGHKSWVGVYQISALSVHGRNLYQKKHHLSRKKLCIRRSKKKKLHWNYILLRACCHPAPKDISNIPYNTHPQPIAQKQGELGQISVWPFKPPMNDIRIMSPQRGKNTSSSFTSMAPFSSWKGLGRRLKSRSWPCVLLWFCGDAGRRKQRVLLCLAKKQKTCHFLLGGRKGIKHKNLATWCVFGNEA